MLEKQPPGGVLKNVAKFTGKRLHQSLFIKKESGADVSL